MNVVGREESLETGSLGALLDHIGREQRSLVHDLEWVEERLRPLLDGAESLTVPVHTLHALLGCLDSSVVRPP